MSDEMMTSTEVCEYLRVSPWTFWRIRKEDGFPEGMRLSKNVSRWKRQDIEDWLSSKKVFK